LATDKRWKAFHQHLSGKSYFEVKESGFPRNFKSLLKQIFPLKLIRLIRGNQTQFNTNSVLSKLRIPIIYVEDVNETYFIDKLEKMSPDLILSAAYPQIFSKELLKTASTGSVNFHPSLLPKYRGAHPHFWAIAKGEKESGLTAHFMTENLDDGDIVAQVKFSISQLSYTAFYDKIIEETPMIVKRVETFFLDKIGSPQPQNHNEASYFREPREIHKRIFWNVHSADEVQNLIRTEQAFCFFRGAKIFPKTSTISDGNRNLTNKVVVETGTIVDISNNSVVIKAKDGCININSIFDSGKKYDALKWAMKRKIAIGEKFE
jgi:methionyl-tRNA formyltransferase